MSCTSFLFVNVLTRLLQIPIILTPSHQIYWPTASPLRKSVGDITYKGWLYCAIIKDLCTKQIVGYAFSEHIDSNPTLAALNMAVLHQRLLNLNICHSMSGKGYPYDNAVAENFFGCLKCECVHLHHYFSREQAMADIFSCIETFYNSVRPHSSIGWLSP